MTENNNQTIRDLAAAVAAPQRVAADALPHIVIPQGFMTQDLERMLPAPRRITARPAFAEPASFVRYVNDFKRPEAIIIAEEHAGRLVAHLDYHDRDAPSWSTHQAILALEPTPEWTAWTGTHRKAMKQVAFAEFIEEHTAEIIEPTGATMLDVALTLQDHRSAAVKSAIRLDNGTVQFSWDEEARATAGKYGATEISQRFTIAISPFKGLAPFRIQALLRYSVDKQEGAVFRVVLKDIEKAKEQGFRDIVKLVAEGAAIPPLMGSRG